MDPCLITVGAPQHNSHITDFQLKMAYQTESIHLSPKIVSSAVAYLNSLTPNSLTTNSLTPNSLTPNSLTPNSLTPNSLTPNPYGFYLVKTANDQPIATLLVTFQSPQSWWIQSVYVHEAHRRQGHFTSLFQAVITKAREANVQKVSLYAESHNHTAIRIYEKLGMHINGLKFYIFDYVLSKILPNIAHPTEGITVNVQQHGAQFVKGRQNVLNGKGETEGGKWVCVKKEGKTVAMGRYFEQFSDWRFGLTRYISHLYIDDPQSIHFILTIIITSLRKSQSLKVAAIRIIHRDIDLTKLEGGTLEPYDVLQIAIN